MYIVHVSFTGTCFYQWGPLPPSSFALWLVSFFPSSFRPGTIKICIYNEEEAITFAAVWHRVFTAIWEKSKEK